ncbi:mitochondrial 54S ribosomal protein uL23m [Colletotrichum truncatum]|uniref:Ribosomal protein L23 n=1 Tax=Colletotrichum truncatum TaxID=5467 RepID=A0ACC3ZJZ9_COLTU|nr:ribosomal protein L23 [Colletotrichum truncatum]KAF6799788.1 ribosomal protein L23 [Colletotrichum truncatum]
MTTAVAEAVARRAPEAFRLGKKEIFLPNHVITFIRKDRQPPNWATFHVPLTFTKFDLRDYLWNLYGVETTAVRAWVKQTAVQRKSNRGGYFRPQSQKFMMVEMTKPFVWPSPPEDLEPWNKKLWEAREQSSSKQYKADYQRQLGKLVYPSKEPADAARKKLRQEAKTLLSGSKKWTGPEQLDSKWDSIVKASKRK